MRIKTFLQTGAGIIGVGILLLGTLFCGNQMVRVQDSKMLNAVHLRTKTGDAVSPQAEKISLVQALWEVEQFYDTQTMFHETGKTESELSEISNEMTLAFCEELQQKNVLPEAVLNAQKEMLEKATFPNGLMAGESGFSMLYGQNFSLYLYDNSLATRGSFSIGEKALPQIDLDACADAYIAYLGLDALGDWEAAPTAQIDKQIAAARYSKSGQLYLIVSLADYKTEGYSFAFGIYPKFYTEMMQSVGANG